MTLRLSMDARVATLNTINDRVNAGAGPGVLQLYTGTQPNSPDVAATGTLLATFTLADPAFVNIANGSMDLDADPDLSAVAINTGPAGWARISDSNGTAVIDGTVSSTYAAGEFFVNSTSITTNQPVFLTTFQINFPL